MFARTGLFFRLAMDQTRQIISLITARKNILNDFFSANFRDQMMYIFGILQHFVIKVCVVTNFKMLFRAVVMDFICFAYKKEFGH